MKFENRKTLLSLLHTQRLKESNIPEAVRLAGMPPSTHSFLSFLRILLVWIGALSLVISLLLFMAYNWQNLDRFSKFMMVEAAMLTSIAVYFLSSKYARVQQIALLLSSITLGILLALIGQTYQTGADPWQLFAVWALLMTPWAVVANTSVLWILWIVLVNVAGVLYYQKLDISLDALFHMQNELLVLLFSINVFLWILWSTLSRKYETFSQVPSIRFLAFMTMGSITSLVMVNLYDIDITIVGYLLVYSAVLGLVYYFYRMREIDLYMMALFSLSVFFFVLSLVIRFIEPVGFNDMISFSFILLIVIAGLTKAIISWIQNLRKELDAKS